MIGEVPPRQVDRSTWAESSARAVLQLMVESVAEMVGFEMAALSVVIGEELVTLAYTGPEEHRDYLEQPDPVSVIAPVLDQAVRWGPRLRFLEATPLDELEGHWVHVEQVGSDHPDAWHAEEGLLAVLTQHHGTPDETVVGILSVDRPLSGRRPDPRQRDLLERYAAQAERAVLTLFEQQALVEQAAHAESARRLIRSASLPTLGSLQDVLRHTHGQLVASFDARGTWLHVLQPGGPGTGVVRTHAGEQRPLPPEALELVGGLAPDLWARQAVVLLEPGSAAPGLLHTVRDHLAGPDAWALGVPLGVGEECVGFLALSRAAEQPGWSAVEVASAQQVGHDLGAALMTARALETERRLVANLQRLDDHRTEVVAMLSHELRTPLTVISGNLELLGETDLDPAARRHHEAMGRGTERMQTVVDDLLMLARVSNPTHPLVTLPLDLRSVVVEAVAMVEPLARSKAIVLEVDVSADPLVVLGDAVELDRVVSNLVSNAVKYTDRGGRVSVRAHRTGADVVLQVSDTGLGISEDDQRGLFRAFYRTSNPAALRESGTGLGLATVATVVQRHGGTVGVSSTLGEGSTFTVTLPS